METFCGSFPKLTVNLDSNIITQQGHIQKLFKEGVKWGLQKTFSYNKTMTESHD